MPEEGYSVAKLKDLTVELLPNNRSATTQEGRLIILYLTQQNSKNWTIYDLPLKLTTIGFDVVKFCAGIAWTLASVIVIANLMILDGARLVG